MIAYICFFTPIVYIFFIRDYFVEVDATGYVHAKEYYATSVATEKLYCEFLEDHFLSEREYRKLQRIKLSYMEREDNEEAKALADSIKSEACTQ